MVHVTYESGSDNAIEELISQIKETYEPTLWLVDSVVMSNESLFQFILSSPHDGSPNYYRYKSLKSSRWKAEDGLTWMVTKLRIKSAEQAFAAPEVNSNSDSNRNSNVSSSDDRQPSLMSRLSRGDNLKENTERTHFASSLNPAPSEYVNDGTALSYDPSMHIYNFLASRIDVTNTAVQQVMAGLLSFMEEQSLHVYDNKITLLDAIPLDNSNYMRIDSEALEALNIFQNEIHPNVLKGKGKAKEGLSLFALLDRTRSPSGKKKLKDWMKRPFYDFDKLLQRQAAVECMWRTRNLEWSSEVSKHMRKLGDIPNILLSIKKATSSYNDWLKLQQSILSGLSIADLMKHFVSTQVAYDENGSTASGNKRRLMHLEKRGSGSKDKASRKSYRDSVNDVEEEAEEDSDDAWAGFDRDEDISITAQTSQPVRATLVQQATMSEQQQCLESDKQSVNSFLSALEGYLMTLTTVYRDLNSVIDTELSQAEQQLSVREGYDTELDILRSRYDNVSRVLLETGRDLLQLHPLLERAGIEYIPRLGYLVKVEAEDEHLIESINRSASYESANSTANVPACYFEALYRHGGTIYYRHALVQALDEAYGDIKTDINDRQRLVLLDLEERLLQQELAVQQLANVMAEIDATMSLGVIARERNFTKPQVFADRSLIAIKGGRHPLQELTVDHFVPNDTYFDNDSNVTVITGPNSSGKSIYIKQVGLIVYLTQLGSFVPAEQAQIGLVDQILTRITTIETTVDPQSTFTKELTQMSKVLSLHTEKSLCLVDEFGKGTSPVDGASLLATVIEHFAEDSGSAGASNRSSRNMNNCSSMQVGSPSIVDASRCKIMFTLHFTEVLSEGILSTTAHNHLLAFQMQTVSSLGDDSGDLLDTLGVTSSSTTNQSDSNTVAVIPAGELSIADLTDASTGRDQEESEEMYTCIPLYQLVLGTSASSNGLACARAAGLPRSVVRRAAIIKSCISNRRMITLPDKPRKLLDLLQSISVQKILRTFLNRPRWIRDMHNTNSSDASHVSTDGDDILEEDACKLIQLL